MSKGPHNNQKSYAHRTSLVTKFPIELLASIFYLAHEAEPSCVTRLAFVCSQWRLAALSSPLLWTRIDCRPHPSKGFYRGVVDQAQLYISRSDDELLDFYLSAQSESYNNNCGDTPVEGLCRRIAPRMRSLHLDLGEFSTGQGDSAHSVLSTLFSHCLPGVFTKFATHNSDLFVFLTATDDGAVGGSTLKLGLKQEDLDRILSSVTVLHLTGLYPRWTSHAYHGLVDLRLYAVDMEHSESNENSILEAEFMKILSGSPGLRILHVYLAIIVDDWPFESLAASRVRLADLEVLQVSSVHGGQIHHVLRLIEPGPKPLHLAICQHHNLLNTLLAERETLDFFARSNVTKFYVEEIPQLYDLLSTVPSLHVLIVAHRKDWLRCEPPVTLDQHNDESLIAWPRLDACVMLYCSVPLDKLIALARLCQPKTMTLFQCRFYGKNPNDTVEVGIVEKVLASIYPELKVKIPSVRPNLAEHQELFYGH